MEIIIKKKSSRPSEPLFIFAFKTKEEAAMFLDGMNKFLENESMLPSLKDSVEDSLKRMKERCDDRYANEEHQVSTLLFQSELPGLIWSLLMHAAIKY